MEFIYICVFILSCYGICYGIIESKIFEIPREYLKKINVINELISCYLCTGFWVGFFMSIVLLKFDLLLNIIIGLSIATTSILIDSIINLLVNLNEYIKKKTDTYN